MGQPLSFELFCLFIHDELMQDEDEHHGMMGAFKVFDEDEGGRIEPREMITVSQRLEQIEPSKLKIKFKFDKEFVSRIFNG